MKRSDFLKGLGLVGLGSVLPTRGIAKTAEAISSIKSATPPVCILIPQETAGPYPLDLSGNPDMFRQDIREDKLGTQLDLTLTIVNVNDDCAPIPNARVDIWHCDKDGYYAGFTNPGYLGTQNNVGKTFFRGIQITDSNGQVKFTTIYPGWYMGRVTHIHFQVFLNSVLSVTSQLAFPDDLNETVNGTSLYSPHGQNSTDNSSDGVFQDGANTQYQIVEIVPNANTGGYDALLMVGISAPVSGVINLEPETGGQFKLHPNFPNPFAEETQIAFTLHYPAAVKLELFDLSGKKVAVALDKRLASGHHSVSIDKSKLGLSSGSYAYQLTTQNDNGQYSQTKLLTVK